MLRRQKRLTDIFVAVDQRGCEHTVYEYADRLQVNSSAEQEAVWQTSAATYRLNTGELLVKIDATTFQTGPPQGLFLKRI